jgi:hypothetical protein
MLTDSELVEGLISAACGTGIYFTKEDTEAYRRYRESMLSIKAVLLDRLEMYGESELNVGRLQDALSESKDLVRFYKRGWTEKN